MVYSKGQRRDTRRQREGAMEGGAGRGMAEEINLGRRRNTQEERLMTAWMTEPESQDRWCPF